ncbi:hypothetical protein DAERI_060116 [Deinococcus aerius]|uniref:Terminase large subunit gp17-like C-terminal domain-containing protein n=1 Tax=Deinococcus aerius TaxID=200253 RepID=A0A2I9D5C2_9DEIO|nr:terminase family protein [Deinococcus aerius]GBF05856.1 hypothetical protein DAERI_060116 [Deinococcus aerius]
MTLNLPQPPETAQAKALKRKGILMPYQKRWVNDSSRFKIGMWSRQTGKSFASTLEYSIMSVRQKDKFIYMSSGERQARELRDKAKMHLTALRLAAQDIEEREDIWQSPDSGEEYKLLEISLPNGSQHLFIPANPDTARGFSGHVFLDEFDILLKNREIWTSLFPIITRFKRYRLRVMSTPKLQGQFRDLWDRAYDDVNGLALPGEWSAHKVNILDAVGEGLDVDPEQLRRSINNELAWEQEFMLKWVDEDTVFLPYQLIASCVQAGATVEFPGNLANLTGEVYIGVDIAWERHLFVVYVVERVAGRTWTRAIIRLKKPSVAEARGLVFGLIPLARRVCIDATGPGEQMGKEAREAFGSKVEAIKFNGAVKEDLAVTLKRAFEDRSVAIPDDEDLREALHAVRMQRTASNHMRYDAAATDKGHADEFWALALALHAQSVTPTGGIITL